MNLSNDKPDCGNNSSPENRVFDGRRVIDSRDIFQKDREVVIAHGDSFYRLQITKLGKLILIK